MSINNHQKKLKAQIIKHTKNIKQKLLDLKNLEHEYLQFNTETFKPITSPLQKISSSLDSNVKPSKIYSTQQTQTILNPTQHQEQQTQDEQFDEQDVAIASTSGMLTPASSPVKQPQSSLTPASKPVKQLQTFMTPDKPTLDDYLEPLVNVDVGKRGYDNIYGPQYINSKVMLGDTELDFHYSGKTLNVQQVKFNVTPGLLELIFKLNPKHYDKFDLSKYREILKLTNAHRQNADQNSPIIVSTTNKYKTIISKLFKDEHPQHTGKGLLNWKDVHINHKIDYKYWTNPNILVDRLRLLVASSNAGNNSHNNEIQEIIQELKNKQYIL